jgi:hypothetical protein
VTPNQRRHHAISLQQAAQEAAPLARLGERIQASSQRLASIRPLLPGPLRSAVQAGPYEDGQWCLLVSSNAVAAKLRQLLPVLRQHLVAQDLPVQDIRLKVSNSR